ncbi:molybdopterin synthase subunit MoaE/molybdopterin synthase subunit MoaD [Bellilinea caldifistulae]|nr:molybdopterin converting factor subunit 1 [Bellilinea caldifistulae]GAP11240.1 molybdopterin synthase subunit MoaE/molybdopterin synthase subunit MoaD [Bellilinea caldifistulae]
MSEMGAIKVLFFAHLKELCGVDKEMIVLPQPLRVADLKRLLGERFPLINERLANVLVAVNQQYAADEDWIQAGDEVAFFPPVSGGSPPTIFRITSEELDLNELLDEITLPTTGAACIFTGMVRGETWRGEVHQTIALEYEAYVPMAEAKMAQVAAEIRARWPAVEGIAIVQRVGHLKPRTPTVMIACTAAHRDTGVFEAARYGIDRLKEIVPIWKKEIMPNGEEWIEGSYHPQKGE